MLGHIHKENKRTLLDALQSVVSHAIDLDISGELFMALWGLINLKAISPSVGVYFFKSYVGGLHTVAYRLNTIHSVGISLLY